MVEALKTPRHTVRIAMVGKYVALHDAYLSVVEALKHGGVPSGTRIEIAWVDSETVTRENARELLEGVHGILIPGGFGIRGVEGKIEVARFAREQRIPYLGICLGLQLLFESSEEMGAHRGLAVLEGTVPRFSENLTVPHMGWNQIDQTRPIGLFADVPDHSYAYFVHSYYVKPSDPAVVAASTHYGLSFASIVAREHLYGIQFHPEKSQDVGARILRNWLRLAGVDSVAEAQA